MKRIELDKVFTEKVNEYLMKGYVISTESMRGSQGETAKIDLIKGSELIRVWMNKESKWSIRDEEYNKWHGDMMVIRVSRWSHPAHLAYTHTVWMSDLETIEEDIYYKVWTYRNEWYVDTIEEAESILALQHERHTRREFLRNTLTDITSPNSQEIARRYLISHGHYQRVSMDQIQVIREGNKDTTHHGYRIRYKGTNYYMQ